MDEGGWVGIQETWETQETRGTQYIWEKQETRETQDTLGWAGSKGTRETGELPPQNPTLNSQRLSTFTTMGVWVGLPSMPSNATRTPSGMGVVAYMRTRHIVGLRLRGGIWLRFVSWHVLCSRRWLCVCGGVQLQLCVFFR